MSSANSLFFKCTKTYPLFKTIFLYYNIYVRNLKFFFNNSQFGEDKKILKLFKNKRKGIYLDLGCFHPIRQNNTYLLHKLGWKGINIDLNPLAIDLFNIARPNDINICSAISGKKGTKNLFFDHELSSLNTINKNHTLFLKKAFGKTNLKKRKIKTNTLNNILKKHNIKKIDFMNIDIEGNELEVLKTLNLKKIEIKVICIEIVNYQIYSKNIMINKNKIFNILKKNNYSLKFKTFVNYIFIKNEYKI
jgi:FkbM family methyltransferase